MSSITLLAASIFPPDTWTNRRSAFSFLEDKREVFEGVEIAGTVHSDYAMPYENDLQIYICRNLKVPLDQMWERLKHYD